MSPINEDDLRAELHQAHPSGDGFSAESLGALATARGRGVRRRRRALGSVAAVIVVALGAVGVWNLFPNREQQAIPASTPSPTATPSTSPSVQPTASTPSASTPPPSTPSAPTRPAWTDATMLPASLGDLGDVRLLHEGADAQTGDTVWRPEASTAYTCGTALSLPALRDLAAGRRIATVGPVGTDAEAMLVFRSEDAARTFLRQLRTGADACAQRTPTPDPGQSGSPTERSRATVRAYDLGAEGLITTFFTERRIAGGWTVAPGATATLWVRQGRAVTLAETSGEYVGDIPTTQPDVISGVLRPPVLHALEQMCAYMEPSC